MASAGRGWRWLVLSVLWATCALVTKQAALHYGLMKNPEELLRDAQLGIGLMMIMGVGWIVGVLPVAVVAHLLSRRPRFGVAVLWSCLLYEAAVLIFCSWMEMRRLGEAWNLMTFANDLMMLPFSPLGALIAIAAPKHFVYGVTVLPLLALIALAYVAGLGRSSRSV